MSFYIFGTTSDLCQAKMKVDTYQTSTVLGSIKVKYILLMLLFSVFADDTSLFAQTENDTLDYMSHMGADILILERPYQSGDLTMTQNQYKIMPASFQDPARILLKYPGFSTPNDGANAIIFRGMPPESARWQLFGADIVNPNHLSNAGTANDLATGNAGGVNALSGSVLDYYHFEANPADISYADVLSGVSNMKMAPKIKTFVDLNLIGLEAGFGLSRGNKNVYASYRYSFVGLLDKLGVNFGNEKIGYQDLSMYVDFIKNDHHSLKMFATLGNSSNVFSAVSRGDSITRLKDIQNISYKSELVLCGVQYTYEKANRYFQSTVVTSARNDSRSESTDAFYVDSLGLAYTSNQLIKERLISNHNQYVLDANGQSIIAGLRMNFRFGQQYLNIEYDPIVSIYPYFQYKSNKNNNFQYHAAIGGLYDNHTNSISAEPSTGLLYKLSKRLTVNLDYRLSSFINTLAGIINDDYLDRHRVKSHNIQSGFQYIHEYLQFRGSVFYHQLWNLHVYRGNNTNLVGHFSSFNGTNLGYDQLFSYLDILPNGTSQAKVVGTEIFMENTSFLNGNALNYGVNVSVFDSKYNLTNGGTYFNGRYNFGYTSNVNISYTMDVSNINKERKLIFSLSNHWRGALREQSLLTSGERFSTLYDVNSTFDNKFRPYQRLDFRVVYTKQKASSTKVHRWSLDIQNVLNRENDGFRYYDPLLNSVLLQNQLGLVPVLSYRLEW